MQGTDEHTMAGDLDAALNRWREHLAAHAASINTIEAYARDWHQLSTWLARRLGRPPALSDIRALSPATFRAFLAHRRRLSVRPGITCLWQVSGRNQILDFKDWVRLDLEYIDNWSLWLDLKILFRTVPVVLMGTGAK